MQNKDQSEQELVLENQTQESRSTLTQEQEIQQTPSESPIDYWQLIQNGNFDVALNYSFYPYDLIGPKGFGLIHYLATYNHLEGIKMLKNKKCNLDLVSESKQTALTIACNYGFVEISKFLIENNCKVDFQDKSNFTPLFYTILKKKYALMFYLCTKTKINNLVDTNGCSIVHWAAFENDDFLLRFFKALKIQFDLQDKFGHTPLSRATQNHGYQAAKFFINNYPSMLEYPYEMNGSRYLQYQCSKSKLEYRLTSTAIYSQICIFFKSNQQFILACIFGSSLISELVAFVSSSVQITLNNSYIGILNNLGFIVGMLYALFYTIWFLFKTSANQDQGVKLISRLKPPPSRERAFEENENQNQNPQQQQQQESKLEEEEVLISQNLKKTQKKVQEQIQSMNMHQDTIIIDTNQENNKLIEEFEEEKIIEQEETIPVKVINPYTMDMTPSFLEGITLKDFLSINYKPVEDFIDTMNTPPPQYFRFATRIGQYKEEISALLEINDPLWYSGFTIIHLVYFLFETNRFRAIHNIDWNRICPTCLQYKLPRTSHCTSCNQCVKDFHFHSNLLGKCINSSNHVFFALLIFSITAIINFFILFFWIHYYEQCSSIIVLSQQTFFYIYEESTFISFIYLINLILAPFFNAQSLVEFVCITYNMTYNELFNSHKYRYLYNPVLLANGKVYLRWKKRFQNGILRNYLYYIANQVKNLRLM